MERLPDAPICLRTNGTMLDDSPDIDWIIGHCAEAWVTIYEQTNIGALNRICSRYPHVHIVREPFDNRMAENFEPIYNPKKTYCIRPRYELDIDYYGNGRICCGDWRGELEFGNVIIDGYEPFLQKWLVLRERLWELLNPITPESWQNLPRICKLCLNRTPVMGGSLCE